MDLDGNGRVLVVDDDPDIRRLLVAVLRRAGYELLEACNGRHALREMHDDKPGLVLMDLTMPEVSGWDVLNERAGDLALQQIPIIVVTANNIHEVRAGVVGKDVFEVIQKPFDINTLLTTVSRCFA